MLFADTFNSICIQSTIIPKTVSLFLHLLGIEISQHTFQFCHSLLCLTITQHLQYVELHRIQRGSYSIHHYNHVYNKKTWQRKVILSSP